MVVPHSPLDFPLWILIMVPMTNELIRHIQGVAWDDSCDAETKLTRIQGLLYEAEQQADAKSEEMFGDADTYPYPNMRRC